MLIVKLLFLIAIIIIALLIIIFSESLHISLALKVNDFSYLGVINIKYYFFQIAYNLKEGQIDFLLNSKYFTKKITTITIGDSSDQEESEEESTIKEDSSNKDDSPTDDNQQEINEDNQSRLNKIKQLLKLLYESKKDIMDLLISILGLISFKNSYILMDLGLGDNNLTIKTCNKIWAISAPFYAIGLQTILTPQINQTILKSELNIFFEVELIKILKLIKQVLLNKNLRKIILFFINSSD